MVVAWDVEYFSDSESSLASSTFNGEHNTGVLLEHAEKGSLNFSLRTEHVHGDSPDLLQDHRRGSSCTSLHMMSISRARFAHGSRCGKPLQ
jgi:hypothetical protein